MSLEDKYRASSPKFPNRYSGATQFAKDISKLNVDRKPLPYNGQTRFTKDTSKLNIDKTPSRYAPKR